MTCTDCTIEYNGTDPRHGGSAFIHYCQLHGAAEEMLAACQSMLRVLREDEGYKSYNPVCKRSEQAIAQATGAS